MPFHVTLPKGAKLSKLYGADEKILEKFAMKSDSPALFALNFPMQAFLLELEGVISDPIRITVSPSAKPIAFSLFIYSHEHSRTTITEDWSESVKSPAIVYYQSTFVEENAVLEHIAVQNLSDESNLMEHRESAVQTGAQLKLITYHFGAKAVKSLIEQGAMGQNATIDSDVISRSDRTQNFEFRTHHIYAAKDGRGEIRMKGIAEGKARLNFDGIIKIKQQGAGTQSFLHQETLNLSRDTTVRATPGLEIGTNDVKAGHGASIRNLNSEDLFYFGSRGIAKDSARRLLVQGFLKKEVAQLSAHADLFETVNRSL